MPQSGMRRQTVLLVILVWVLCGSARAEVHELAFESGGVTLEALLHTPESGSANTLVVYLHGNPGRPLEAAG